MHMQSFFTSKGINLIQNELHIYTACFSLWTTQAASAVDVLQGRLLKVCQKKSRDKFCRQGKWQPSVLEESTGRKPWNNHPGYLS